MSHDGHHHPSPTPADGPGSAETGSLTVHPMILVSAIGFVIWGVLAVAAWLLRKHQPIKSRVSVIFFLSQLGSFALYWLGFLEYYSHSSARPHVHLGDSYAADLIILPCWVRLLLATAIYPSCLWFLIFRAFLLRIQYVLGRNLSIAMLDSQEESQQTLEGSKIKRFSFIFGMLGWLVLTLIMFFIVFLSGYDTFVAESCEEGESEIVIWASDSFLAFYAFLFFLFSFFRMGNVQDSLYFSREMRLLAVVVGLLTLWLVLADAISIVGTGFPSPLVLVILALSVLAITVIWPIVLTFIWQRRRTTLSAKGVGKSPTLTVRATAGPGDEAAGAGNVSFADLIRLDAADSVKKSFIEFLRDEMCLESLLFLDAVEVYRMQTMAAVRLTKAVDIYRIFVSDDAPLQVNLPHQSRQALLAALKKYADISKTQLDLAAFTREVYQKMTLAAANAANTRIRAPSLIGADKLPPPDLPFAVSPRSNHKSGRSLVASPARLSAPETTSKRQGQQGMARSRSTKGNKSPRHRQPRTPRSDGSTGGDGSSRLLKSKSAKAVVVTAAAAADGDPVQPAVPLDTLKRSRSAAPRHKQRHHHHHHTHEPEQQPETEPTTDEAPTVVVAGEAAADPATDDGQQQQQEEEDQNTKVVPAVNPTAASLGDKTLRRIRHASVSTGEHLKLEPTLFDQAYDEIYNMLRRDVYIRWLQKYEAVQAETNKV